MAAVLLAAGCGTRLGDDEIIAAASHVVKAPSGSAIPAAGEDADAAAVAPDVESEEAAAATTPEMPGGGAAAPPPVRGTATNAPTGTVAGAATAGTLPGRRPQPAARTDGGPAGPPVGGSAPVQPGTAGPAPVPGPGSPPGPGPGAATPAAKSMITLGNVGDYSGIVGNVLKEGVPMAQVVARHINDNGGLNGHPVKILVADAAGDPSRALSIVRDMVESKGVVAFVGNLWVLSGAGARSYLEQKRVPVIGGEVASSHWFQSPMWFPQASSFPTLSVGAAKTLVDNGKKKIAIAYCAEVEACKIFHDATTARASEIGATVVYTAQVSLAQPDYTAECLQAQRAGAEGLMLGVDSTGLSRFARSCLQQNYRVPIVTVSLATIASTTKDPNLDGLYSPVGTFPYAANDLPATREYRAAIARYAPNIEEGGATSAVWTAGALLREVGKALPVTPGPQDFLDGLWQVKDNNLGGLAPPLTFVKDQPAPDIRCYFLQQISNRTYTAPQGTRQTCL